MLVNSTTRNFSKIISNYSKLKTRNVSISSILNNESTTTNTDQKQQQEDQSKKQPEAAPNVENDFLKSILDKNKKLEVDLADYKDRYVRALAEAENTRVRMRKQVDDAKIFGIQGFCKDLLEVADTLHLAVINTDVNKLNKNSDKLSPEDQLKVAKEQVKSVFDGLVMTEQKLIKIFGKHGLDRIVPTEGEKFDPNIHEAIFQANIPNKESGSICNVNQIGYKLKERVIRAAHVGVVQ